MEFLFKKDLLDYLQNIRNMCIQVSEYSDTYDQLSANPDRGKIIKGQYDIRRFLSEQEKRLIELFSPYLDLTRIWL
jgi:hypothetical protein